MTDYGFMLPIFFIFGLSKLFNLIRFKKINFKPSSVLCFGGGGEDGGGGGETTKNDIQQLPDYPEATGARQNWWEVLQQWGKQPGYGAIAPNWNDIWNQASGRVNRFFAGGPEGPGLNARVSSGLARRGMSEQPAADVLKQRTGFAEGNLLKDLAVTQATNEAAFGEQGRQTWLSSLMSLAGQKPQFQSFGSTALKSGAVGGGADIAKIGMEMLPYILMMFA